MAKKEALRKNSRAARQASMQELDLDIEESTTGSHVDGKTRILEQLAEKGVREADTEDRLGHKVGKSTKVVKKAKKKRDQRKQQKAEAIKDMLQEKVGLAVKRHKVVKGYRKDDEQD